MQKPKPVSKFFRVAVAGASLNGFDIKEEWLREIAQTYDPTLYGARVNIEHFLSLFPGSDMKAQGDVTAVKLQEDEINGEKRLCLYAQIAPLPSLVDMVNRGEKIYCSVEIMPKFPETGKAYLFGLAVTDRPAGIGTEALSFAAHCNVFVGDDLEASIELTEEETTPPDQNQATTFTALRGRIGKLFSVPGKTDPRIDELALVVEDMGKAFINYSNTQSEQFSSQFDAFQNKLDEQTKQIEQLQKNFSLIDNTDANPQKRPAATGGKGRILADC